MSRLFTRGIHLAPRLTLEKSFSQNGIKGLMSPEQFRLGWIEYQDFLTKQLSMKTVDTTYENRSPMAIAMSCSKKNQEADIFHYASQAHNNHLFYQQLKNKDDSLNNIENIIKPQLLNNIKNTFISLENFKNTILGEADILSGNGWIFLIENENKELKIVKCNNDGTPYFYGKNQSIDLNTTFDYQEYANIEKYGEKIKNGVKDYSLPLLCINVWEHSYLLDYGVSGKGEYLENLWDCIDWKVINSRVFSNMES